MTKQGRGGRAVDPGVEARASQLTEGMLRLASKVDLAERFLASAAHEMKTPLANLSGELQLALMRERSAAEYRQAIAMALRHTEQLLELTNDLLMFAKVSYTPAPSEAEPCNVRALILDALDMSLRRKGKREVVVDVDERLSVHGRPDELTRLFRNLLDNAVEYAPPLTPVLARGAVEDDDVLIAVEDAGKALAADLAQSIFLPFQRGPDAVGTGSGLGLGIARAIARGHGGDLTLDGSSTNVRFLVRLPLLSRSA